MKRSFTPKSTDQLAVQLRQAEQTIGAPLRPPQADLAFLKASLKELQTRYPQRYAFYLKALRREKQGAELGEDEARRMKSWLQAMNSLDVYIHDHHKNEEERTLTEHQIPAFEAIRTFFEQGGSKGFVKLPTGSGKTVIFTELIEAMNLKTLVVVPRKLLLTQTVDELSKFAEDLDVGKVYSDAKEHDRQVTVTTYDSFVSGVENGSIEPKNYDLLVLDEVHRGLSEKRKQIIARFSHALQVGFSATPEFSDKKNAEEILPDCIFDMSIREAVEKGMLCSFVSGVIQTNVDLSAVKLQRTGEYDEHELELAIDIESRNRAAVDAYRKIAANEKAVAYCAGVSHAKHVAEHFQKEGIAAVAVWGNMRANELDRMQKNFSSGKVKVICNADLLIEGFNDREVKLCINLRPTRSSVMAEQRGGRVLRTDPKDPNKVACILDFLDRNGSTGLTDAILFSEVAGKSVMRVLKQATPEKHKDHISEESGNEPDDERIENDNDHPITDGADRLLNRLKKVNLEGVEMTFDVEEILKIMTAKAALKEKKRFLSYEEFIIAARTEKIKNQTEYRALCKEHPDWPTAPNSAYRDQWKSWAEITGNVAPTKKEFIPYDELVAALRAIGMKNQREYAALSKQHPNWPTNPERTYKDQWKSWGEITSNVANRGKKFIPFDELVAALRTIGIKNQTEYYELSKKHPDWPARPQDTYKEQWTGWEKITGYISGTKRKKK